MYHCSVTKEDAGQECFESISDMQGEYFQSRQLDARATYHASCTSTHDYNLFPFHAEKLFRTIRPVATAKRSIEKGIIPS